MGLISSEGEGRRGPTGRAAIREEFFAKEKGTRSLSEIVVDQRGSLLWVVETRGDLDSRYAGVGDRIVKDGEHYDVVTVEEKRTLTGTVVVRYTVRPHRPAFMGESESPLKGWLASALDRAAPEIAQQLLCDLGAKLDRVTDDRLAVLQELRARGVPAQFDELKHDAVHADRIAPELVEQGVSVEEKEFAEAWRWENGKRNTPPALVSILAPRGGRAIVSQRDATVAASIIQWLGTNCGRAFIDAVRSGRHREMRDACARAPW